MGNEQGNTKARSPPNGPTLPSNARLMNTAIKQRLQRGNTKSTYNMKVVIRGDRQTGKSALFHRLEGGGFIKEHRTTAQIQCSHVLWPYKTTDEMVNLEIWDVVDKAILPSNLIEDNNGIVAPSVVSKNLLPADSTTIDVYKNAHAIIFMVDPTRKWTFDYVKTNISLIPNGIDSVILFGKKDLNNLWTLTDAEIDEFMIKQPKNIRSLQISLQDCYGMKELHNFFNLPFLRMKAKYLEQELKRAEREYEQSKVELDVMKNHQNYDEFLNRLKALKENKKLKLKAPNSPNMVDGQSFKVKQTVTSSADLPLIQEQKSKEEQKKKEEEEKKKLHAKKLENIETFKVNDNNTNIDDFFADLGHNNDDYKSDENDDDNDDDSDDEIPVKINGFDNENENENENENKKDINNNNNNNNEINGHINGNNNNNDTFNRMPDLKLNENNKRQGLMKVQSHIIQSSDSDEYDDEPLVFAAPKKINTEKITPVYKVKQIKQKKSDKDKDNDDGNLDPIDMGNGNGNDNDNDNDNGNDNDNDKQQELDDFLDDLTGNKGKSVTPMSPKSTKSDYNSDDDEMIRKKKKEEKRRRKKERKKRKKDRKNKKKHMKSEEDNDGISDDDKKKKKKKKKKRKKHKEKDNDLVEYDSDSDDNIVDIE